MGPASGRGPLPHQSSHRGEEKAIPGPAVSRGKGDEFKISKPGPRLRGMEIRDERRRKENGAVLKAKKLDEKYQRKETHWD